MHIQNPLVTVITPVYNSEKFIGETIESVIGQSYKNWEMIIVDDGSTDDTESIIRSYSSKDPRIKYLPLGYNSGGPAVPRNHGIKHAKGEYIAFLDSDDLWLPNKLSETLKVINRTKNKIVYTNVLCIDEKDHPITVLFPPYFKKLSLPSKSKFLILTSPITTSSVTIKKDVFDDCYFNIAAKFHGIEDYLLWLLLNQRFHFYYINIPLAAYRILPDSLLHRDRAGYMKKLLAVYEEIEYTGLFEKDVVKIAIELTKLKLELYCHNISGLLAPILKLLNWFFGKNFGILSKYILFMALTCSWRAVVGPYLYKREGMTWETL